MNINKNYKQGTIEEAFQTFIEFHHCLDVEMARKTFFGGAITLFYFQQSIFENGEKPEAAIPLYVELIEYAALQRDSY